MNSNNRQITVVYANTGTILTANPMYRNGYDKIVWKKKVFTDTEIKQGSHRHIWRLMDDGETIGTGNSIHYTFSKKDEGKYVKLYAYINSILTFEQIVVYYVEPTYKTEICIAAVNVDKKEALVGDVIKLSVEYCRQAKSEVVIPEEKVTQATKDSVKWMVKIDNIEERLVINDEVIRGGRISLEVPEKWAGKNIAIMPYLNRPDTEICVKINTSTYLVIYTSTGKEVFTLDGNSKKLYGKKTVKEIYKLGIQWFEPKADNYLPLVTVVDNIQSFPELLHFSWDNIIEFAEESRWMLNYASKRSGDWKASPKGANGYVLVSIGGIPYWADAIGQIPFTIDYFTDRLEATWDYNKSEKETIKKAIEYGDGNIFGAKADSTNSYDNAMVVRAINWAKKRYKIKKTETWYGDSKNVMYKTDFSPQKMAIAADGTEIK